MIDFRIWQIAGWTMLHYLWVGAVLGVIAAAVRWLMRSHAANLRYLAALGCFAVMSLAPLPIAVVVTGRLPPPPDRLLLETERGLERTPMRSPLPAPQPLAGFASTVPADLPSAVSVPTPQTGKFLQSALDRAAMGLPWLWLIGAPLTFLLTTVGLLGAERLRRQSRLLVDSPIAETGRRLAAALGISRRIGVGICDRIAAPVLLGIFRPLILLPAVALIGWDPRQLEMVLLHELAHVRRWDNLVNLLQRIVESLLFFHPLVWIVSAWVRREREHCCDELVVARTRQPRAYAEMLVELSERVSRGTPRILSPAHASVLSSMAQPPLAARIRHILNKEEQSMQVSRKTVGLVFASLVGMALVIGGYCSRAGHAEDGAVQSVPAAPRTNDPSDKSSAAKPAGEASNTESEPVATIEQISAAWKTRQERVRSARIEWKETELIPKGMKPAPVSSAAGKGRSPAATREPMPPTDLSLERSRTVLLNGRMLRMNREGPYWHSGRAEVDQDAYVSTYDGEVAKSFFDEKSIGELIGFIEVQARNQDFDNRNLLPMALAFRPCDPDMGGRDLAGSTVSPGMETIAGRPCVVITGNPARSSYESLWLDPHRDFVVLRIQDESGNGGRIDTFDISYQKDPSHGWVPSEWKWTATGGISGRLFGRAAAKVTRYAVNTDIPKSAFQFEFPVGTYVSDLREANAERYIVRQGGKKRIITDAEIRRGAGANYKELLSTESGQAGLPK